MGFKRRKFDLPPLVLHVLLQTLLHVNRSCFQYSVDNATNISIDEVLGDQAALYAFRLFLILR